jgi:hypothetical protein
VKEFETEFRDGILRALRREQYARDREALLEAFNVESLPNRLVAFVALTHPFSASEAAVDWPFPQLCIGQDVMLLGTRTKVYEVSGTWTLIARATVTEYDTWHIADFGDYMLLTNGETVLARSPATGLLSAQTGSTSFPLFRTVCNFKGQIIAGNIQGAWNGCGAGSVAWSRIGSANFTIDKENVAGFLHLPRPCTVFKVLPLDTGVVVYTNRGVWGLRPVSEPAVGFALINISDHECAGRDAAAGDGKGHVFLDSLGDLWAIGTDMKAEYLGYKEFLTSIKDDPILSFDSVNARFFCCTDDDSYVLRLHEGRDSRAITATERVNFGLTEVRQIVTSVAFLNGVALGTASNLSGSTDGEFRLMTDIMDFGQRSQKTIQTIELGGESTADLYVAADWRMDKTAAWTSTGWVRTNPQGVAALPVAGVEFRFKVKSSSFSGVSLDYMLLKFKMTDRRSIRGVNVSKITDRPNR